MLIQHGRLVAFFVVLISILSLQARPAGAQITVGGDPGEVSPADPSTWTSRTNVRIGIDWSKSGTVTVAGGSVLSSSQSTLGYYTNSTGTVTVTGSGSTWNAATLAVGYGGAGTLMVANGGTVNATSTSGTNYIGEIPIP